MADDVILENTMSAYGLRTLHLVRMGAAPDLDGWRGKLPVCAEETLQYRRWVERGLGVHHLELYWNAREMTQIVSPGREPVAVMMWAIETRQRMSEALAEACTRYFFDNDRDADLCLVQKVPAGAPVDKPVEVMVLGKVLPVRILTARWVPKTAIVVLEGDAKWLTEI